MTKPMKSLFAIAALTGLALFVSPAFAESRAMRAIVLADACVPPGVTENIELAPTCTEEQRSEVGNLAMDIAVLLSIISSGDRMTADAVRDCTSSYAKVEAMTACLQVKTEAMTWITSNLPALDMKHQLVFGGCALDNGSKETATVDIVATVECYKALKPA